MKLKLRQKEERISRRNMKILDGGFGLFTKIIFQLKKNGLNHDDMRKFIFASNYYHHVNQLEIMCRKFLIIL
jgi:hypothetical protein